jgi:endoglucanase
VQYEIDVTSYAKSEKAAGRNVITLGLHSPTSTSTLATLNSREATSNKPLLVITPASGITLPPTADAYVRDGTSAATNFGTATMLNVKLNTSGFNRDSYLKFDLSSASSISNATLKFFATSSEGTAITIAAFPVSNTSWTETGITWNNKPALGATQIGSVVVNGTPLVAYQIDVTSYAKSEKAAGRNVITLGLHSPTSTSTLATLNSREAASNGPSLIVTQ